MFARPRRYTIERRGLPQKGRPGGRPCRTLGYAAMGYEFEDTVSPAVDGAGDVVEV